MVIIYPDLSIEDREQLLKNQAAKQIIGEYQRSMQESEVSNEEKKLSHDFIEKQKLEAQLQKFSQEIKGQIKNLEATMVERSEKIKSRKHTVHGTQYGIANHAEGRMMFYDKFGELVDSRELLPEEKQGQLFIGTHNAASGKKTYRVAEDLPTESAKVVGDILDSVIHNPEYEEAEIVIEHNEEPATEMPADILTNPEYDHDTTKQTLDNIPHTEDGWMSMSDKQLIAKYGTTDISKIRVMKKAFGKWITPKNGLEAQQSSVIETEEQAKEREAKFQENAKKNTGKK